MARPKYGDDEEKKQTGPEPLTGDGDAEERRQAAAEFDILDPKKRYEEFLRRNAWLKDFGA